MEPVDAMRFWLNLGPAAYRVWFASRLYAAGQASVVVLSGGSDMTVALYGVSWASACLTWVCLRPLCSP